MRKLNTWMEKAGIAYFSFVNCSHKPGDFRKVYKDLLFLVDCLKGHSKVVALGVETSKILSNLGVPHIQLPHPSGLNRKLNDKVYENRVITLLRDFYWK